MAPTSNPSPTATRTRAPRLDAVCADAVELARDSITEVAPEYVGEHTGARAEADRVVTHLFECSLPGYAGWRWAVTVTRAPRSRRVTVSETVLLPGPEALRAPDWVPWEERLEPGDLGVGDLLPTAPEDERLVPGYVESDDSAVEEVAWELGLGRARVLSRQGRTEAAQRWYEGDHGPEAPISAAAPPAARCAGCGFYLPLAGALRQAFGVCGNLFAPDDGRVVSADHGCGAHSEVMVESGSGSVRSAETPAGPVVELPTVYDDTAVEPLADPPPPRAGDS
jgi:hypothetical protein